MNLRVVFDTSTLVGAALHESSVPDQALQRTLASFELCISAETLTELQSARSKPRLARYITVEARQAFVDVLRRNGTGYVVGESNLARVDPPCRDAKDNFILALALTANANIIVSSDHDLLVLNPWRGIPILTPAELVKQFPA